MPVTGDKSLLQAGPLQKRVITPQDFVAQVLDKGDTPRG
jgi:predicted nucleic acid-binding protein